MRLLLAEDEHALGTWLSKALTQSGYEVDWVDDGLAAERALARGECDVVILDLGLPGKGGHEVLQALRARDRKLPVLVLTARDSLGERVSTLNEGADDFLAKPFALAELEARLAALIRRSREEGTPPVVYGPLEFLPETRHFRLLGKSLSLTPRETALLCALMQPPERPVAKADLLVRVFDGAPDVQPEAIEVLIHRLRKRIEGSGVRIATLRGLGYALERE
jgi:two-component system response regulator TctD